MIKKLKYNLKKFYSVYLSNNTRRKSYYKFVEADGESTLRLQYPLDENSIVFDLGGFEGDFTQEMVDRYSCHVYVFEPIASLADQIRRRFKGNDKVTVVQAGLGIEESSQTIKIAGASSSIYNYGKISDSKDEEIKILSIKEYIDKLNGKEIDLMKINIEGAEFELLEFLLSNDKLMSSIVNFQIQFHDFIDNSVDRRASIQAGLAKSHDKLWDFPFIWEGWRKKTD